MNPNIDFLETLFEYNGYRCGEEVVVSALINNNLDIIKWLIHKQLVTAANTFIYCCELGQIVTAKWLLANYYSEINNVKTHEHAFLRLCIRNHLETVKWLLDMFPFLKSSSRKFETFHDVCRMGNLDIAKWLLTIWPDFDLRFNDCEILRTSCFCGHIEIAKWLHSICGVINVGFNDFEIFRKSCHYGNLEITKWLLETFPEIDIRTKGDNAFIYTNNAKLAVWLATLCENYFIVIDDNMKIKSRKISTDQELVVKRKLEMKIKLLQSKIELLQQSGDDLSAKKIEVAKLKIEAINNKL